MTIETGNPFLEKEIKNIQKGILIITFATIFSAVFFFGINYFLDNMYDGLIEDKKTEQKQIDKKIASVEQKIEQLLEGKDFKSIKGTQQLFEAYYQSRFKNLPKVLIIEMLEEILPDNSKIGSNITISKNLSVSLELYSDADSLKEIDDLYNKFFFYQDKLGLITINKGFNTIELKKGNEEYDKILGKRASNIYKTSITFDINVDKLREYYSYLFKPTDFQEDITKFLGKDIIEPRNISNNVGIDDTILLHKIFTGNK